MKRNITPKQPSELDRLIHKLYNQFGTRIKVGSDAKKYLEEKRKPIK